MPVAVWIAMLVAFGLLLMLGVERLLRRFGVRPDRPEDLTGGMRDVLERVEQWQRDHERRGKKP